MSSPQREDHSPSPDLDGGGEAALDREQRMPASPTEAHSTSPDLGLGEAEGRDAEVVACEGVTPDREKRRRAPPAGAEIIDLCLETDEETEEGAPVGRMDEDRRSASPTEAHSTSPGHEGAVVHEGQTLDRRKRSPASPTEAHSASPGLDGGEAEGDDSEDDDDDDDGLRPDRKKRRLAPPAGAEIIDLCLETDEETEEGAPVGRMDGDEEGEEKTRTILSRLEEALACSACNHQLLHPRTLDCGHTMCRSCIVDWFHCIDVHNKDAEQTGQERRHYSCRMCRWVLAHRPTVAETVENLVNVVRRETGMEVFLPLSPDIVSRPQENLYLNATHACVADLLCAHQLLLFETLRPDADVLWCGQENESDQADEDDVFTTKLGSDENGASDSSARTPSHAVLKNPPPSARWCAGPGGRAGAGDRAEEGVARPVTRSEGAMEHTGTHTHTEGHQGCHAGDARRSLPAVPRRSRSSVGGEAHAAEDVRRPRSPLALSIQAIAMPSPQGQTRLTQPPDPALTADRAQTRTRISPSCGSRSPAWEITTASRDAVFDKRLRTATKRRPASVRVKCGPRSALAS
ncbi:hypothetical protein SCHPADRAFT_946050 [Schizopora paradoxa]|uniref:RING-type domain-containing protein n=1 Tax=Schizopora paradoxa TaxID=27342 RepID=A0A0H2R3Z4_9AGAM|nr:hypothetical protein SCHPADRAFT_946050 [Schizopora paradoxa]